MKFIKKYLLRNLLEKKCPYSVPRSGDEAEAVNCFNVYLFKNDKVYMVITELHGDILSGKVWAPGGFGEIETMNIQELKQYELRITHHYGIYDTKYVGFIDFALTGFTKIDQLKCIYFKWVNETKQYFYNRRQLATFDRIEILRAIVDMKMSGHGDSFMAMDILTHLYSMRWVVHPESDILETRIQLFVDSFVESGELKKLSGADYSVSGKAINTLSKYEEQERRHYENKVLQKRMLYLTLAIVAVGVMQTIVSCIKE